MKSAIFILAMLAAAAASAQTNQAWKTCRNPVRVFPGAATVDLRPLFAWWARQPTNSISAETNSAADTREVRPLAAWRLVTGTPVSIFGDSWVVDAAIYTSPTVLTNARIILNHPPTVEEERFNNLKTQITYLDGQIAATRRAYDTATNAEALAYARVEMYRRSISKVAPTGVVQYSRTAEREHDAAAAALNETDQLEAQKKEIEAELKTIPSHDGVYRIEWFAVDRGHTKAGVPIFDLGLVSATPP
jgi:hypothetical protein